MLLEASDNGGVVGEEQLRAVVSGGHGFEVRGFALVVEESPEWIANFNFPGWSSKSLNNSSRLNLSVCTSEIGTFVGLH